MSTRASKRKEAATAPPEGGTTTNEAAATPPNFDSIAVNNKRAKTETESADAFNNTTTEATVVAVVEEAAAAAAAGVVTNTTKSTKPPPRTVNAKFPSHLNPTDPTHFDHFLFQLLAFRAETNNTNFNVHKDEYPALYSWLQFLKREYKHYSNADNNSSQLSAQQVAVLESLHVPLTSRGDEHWNRFYELLVEYKQRHGHLLVPRLCEVPGLGDWVTDQRRQYKAKQQGQSTQLSGPRQEKLEALEFVWHVRNRPEWETRYSELIEYKAVHGDCKVPQHYKPNKALGKWVAKQREQYKLMQNGLHSFLTPYRLEKLNVAGFVWQVRTALDSEARTAMAEAATATTSPAATAATAAVASPSMVTPEADAQHETVDADIHEAVVEEMSKQEEMLTEV